MNLKIKSCFVLGNIFLSSICLSGIATAQISSDGTTPTTVSTDDAVNFLIEGGDRAPGAALRDRSGDNLFHSFRNFSIPNLGSAYFNNSTDISNIFSRVTGGSISEIQGLIRANGTANLFLINPAGIVFGENASLNIGGSFFASTAESIVFEDGIEFSAIEPQEAPLLTINITPGLQYGTNPLPIEVQGGNLRVTPGQTLGLLGGDLIINGGSLTASGGRVELGGLSESGIVEIRESVIFPPGVARGNVSLTNTTLVDVTSVNGGSIAINAADFQMSEESTLQAGLTSGGSTTEAISGDITINTVGNINLSERSLIANEVETDAVGNGGKIEITTNSLSLTGGSRIQTETDAVGSSGEININANSNINISGYAEERFFSGILTIPAVEADGDGGNINIETNNLFLTESGRISIETKGAGNSGNLNIQATGDIEITGANPDGLVSRFDGEVDRTATGNGGNIFIETTNLRLIDGGRISVETESASNAGNLEIKATGDVEIIGSTVDEVVSRLDAEVNNTAMGNGGNISIEAHNLRLIDGGRISFETEGEGNAGNLNIKTTGDVELRGASNRFVSRFDGDVEGTATGNGGNISIEAHNLRLIDGGRISFETEGKGNGGNLTIKTTGDMEIIGIDLDSRLFSRIDGDVDDDAMGNGGNISIETTNLRLINGGRITLETEAQGNAGDLTIQARGDIDIIGVHPLGPVSLIDADVDDTAVGNGGSVSIETTNLRLIDGGRISVETDGVGNAGNLEIVATESVQIVGNSFQPDPSGLEAEVSRFATGDGGDISIQTNYLLLSEGGRISANTDGMGRGGVVTINATDVELVGISDDGRSISRIEATSSTDATAGNLNINTQNLSVSDRAELTVSGLSSGDAGNLNINANNIFLDNQGSLQAQVAVGNQGNINLETKLLLLRNGGNITTNASAQATGGNININILNLVALENSDITANALQGKGGNIFVNAQGIFLSPDSQITASSEFGIDGVVTLNTPDIDSKLGIRQLPTDTTDAGKQIAQGCAWTLSSSFYVIGRGGIMGDPGSISRDDKPLADVRDLSEFTTSARSHEDREMVEEAVNKPIVEANAMIINEEGNVELVAIVPNPNSSEDLSDVTCSGQITH